MLLKMEIPRLKDFFSKLGMKLFAPSTAVTLGHYETFLQSYQLSCKTNDLGRCNFSPSYHFKSKTGKRAEPNPNNIMCDICQTTYSGLLSLNRHEKAKTNHTK